jgi:3-oxoacyl-[acyl-carrier-protein] synthase II
MARSTLKRRVVVTGTGAVSPLGLGVEENWKALLEGRSGISKISLFDSSTFPTKIGGEVKPFDLEALCPGAQQVSYAGRNTHFAVAAAQMAYTQAGLDKCDYDPFRMGIYLGSGEGAQDFFNFVDVILKSSTGPDVNTADFLKLGEKRFRPLREIEQEPNMPAAHLAGLFRANGPNSNCLTACAASSQAIGEATELIRLGKADIVMSGGTHSMLHPFGIAGFNLLTALSTWTEEPERASRPFDRKREGFILGEGAGIVILEELEHAQKRGAKILGEVIGYGSTADAYRLTDAHPEGRGAIKAMRGALGDAGIGPKEINYINAHGTSTEVNDKVETKAIREVFGKDAYNIPVSSTKSMMGHLIAAAGAVELIVCLLTIRDGIIPPTINYEYPDPECDLDYVPNKAKKARVDTALSNSFGFGGQNITLIVREFKD